MAQLPERPAVNFNFEDDNLSDIEEPSLDGSDMVKPQYLIVPK